MDGKPADTILDEQAYAQTVAEYICTASAMKDTAAWFRITTFCNAFVK